MCLLSPSNETQDCLKLKTALVPQGSLQCPRVIPQQWLPEQHGSIPEGQLPSPSPTPNAHPGEQEPCRAASRLPSLHLYRCWGQECKTSRRLTQTVSLFVAQLGHALSKQRDSGDGPARAPAAPAPDGIPFGEPRRS